MDCGHTADIQTTWGRYCNGQGCSCPRPQSCVDLNTSVRFLRFSSGSYWDMLVGSPSLRNKLWRNGDRILPSKTTSRTLHSYGRSQSLKENKAHLQHLLIHWQLMWMSGYRHPSVHNYMDILSSRSSLYQFQHTYLLNPQGLSSRNLSILLFPLIQLQYCYILAHFVPLVLYHILNVNIYVSPLITLNPNAMRYKKTQRTCNKWMYFTNSTSFTKCHTTQIRKQLDLINQHSKQLLFLNNENLTGQCCSRNTTPLKRKWLIVYSEKHPISINLLWIGWGTLDPSKSVNSPRGHLFCFYFKYVIKFNKLRKNCI